MTLDRGDLALTILSAAGWARVGLTVRDERLRERAAEAMAAAIIDRLEDRPRPDGSQLALPL